MASARKRLKKRLCLQHRKEQYLHAIQKVIDGEAPVSYASYRWEKYKQISK